MKQEIAKNDKNVRKFAEAVLKSSGKIAIKYFRKNSHPEFKKDGSLVTRADREIEHFIRLNIKKQFPQHAILGEEFGFEKSRQKESEKKKYTWVIDPIDGTSSFSAGRPIFGIMLGLLENGEPVLGAVYQPITEELWIGYKGKAYFNNKLLKPRKPSSKKPIIATTSPHLLNKTGIKEWEKARKNALNTIYGGDCYNYCLFASGSVDFILEQGLKPHDYLPLLPILKGVSAKIDLVVHDDSTADLKVYC
jgi:histidinol phosphatase-like enzyme (inositol monophosphatase family)